MKSGNRVEAGITLESEPTRRIIYCGGARRGDEDYTRWLPRRPREPREPED